MTDASRWEIKGDPQLCEQETTAATYCANLCSGIPAALDWKLTEPIWCWGAPTTGCSTWDPESNIFFNTSNNTHYVGYAFISGVINDPDEFLSCDDAKVLKLSSEDGFRISDADSGELLYELGLRDGDKIVAINNLPLDSYQDTFDAIALLWLNGESIYTLEIERSMTTTYLNYALLFTL